MAKVIVITGAGSGLGRALALRFAEGGDRVVLFGRTAAKVAAVAAEIGEAALAVACDVRSPDSVRAAFATLAAEYPQIDMLINNAAFVEASTLAEASDDHILDGVLTNTVGPMLCARAAIPLLRRGGMILNVTSGAVTMNFPSMSVYGASKAGLEKFSNALHDELQPLDIAVAYVRCGQMIEEEGAMDNLDPALAALADTFAKGGIDPRSRPSSTFASVAEAIHALVDMPADVVANGVVLRPRPKA